MCLEVYVYKVYEFARALPDQKKGPPALGPGPHIYVIYTVGSVCTMWCGVLLISTTVLYEVLLESRRERPVK
jgi:hypothetical protein